MTVNNSQRRYPRRLALLLAFALSVSILPFDLPGLPLPEADAGPSPIEVYLIPLPEGDIRSGSLALYSGTSDDVRTIISITGAVDGTIVYYDHWEDGFELDLANLAQATTEVWGDGSAANGAPAGCSADLCDAFQAGDNAALISNVPANPRDPVTVLYDGGGEGVSRAVNLGGYDRATLSFDFARSDLDNANDFVVLEATDGSGGWDELAKWEGPGSDPVFLSTSYSLDAYLTAGGGDSVCELIEPRWFG